MGTETLGQAIDTAINTHLVSYPESNVYAAHIGESSIYPDCWRVDLDAEHFSGSLTYYVKR